MVVVNKILVSETLHEGRFDAEFYHPKYELLNSILSNFIDKDKLGYLSNFIKKGIFDISPTKYKSVGIPLIRTTQIKTPVSNENNLIFISEDEHFNNQFKTVTAPLYLDHFQC
ncbi:MAG: hypothetical protein K8S16_03150 [Bacteroidales bacterium]|nr:hypothetical protein [Bacteroidales bacterium]